MQIVLEGWLPAQARLGTTLYYLLTRGQRVHKSIPDFRESVNTGLRWVVILGRKPFVFSGLLDEDFPVFQSTTERIGMDGTEQVEQETIKTIVEFALKFIPFVCRGRKTEPKFHEGKSESSTEVVFSAKGDWNFEVARRNFISEG